MTMKMLPPGPEALFAALGHSSRYQIAIRLLAEHEALPIVRISALTGLAGPATTTHIKALTEAGVVAKTRVGRMSMCELTDEAVAVLGAFLAHSPVGGTQ